MKKSSKIIRNAMIVMIFGLTAMSAQAQSMHLSHYSSALFVHNTGTKIVSEYQEGVAITKHLNKFGLVNKEGFEICKPQYDDVHLFNHGYAAVKKNNKWTFVNKQGNKLTSFRYDWVGNFEQGYAPVMQGGKWGILNEQGHEVVAPKYKKIKVDKKGAIWILQKNTWKPFNVPTLKA